MDGARWSCFITIWVLLVTVGAEDLPWWLVQPSGSAFGGGGNSYQRPAGYVPVQSASNNGYGAGLGTNNGFSSVPSSTNNGFGAVPQASVGANNGFGAVPSAGVGDNHGFGTVPSAGIGANNGFGVVPSAGVGTSNGFSAVPSSPNNGYGAGVGANNGFGAVPQVGVSANNGFGAVPSADLGANNVFGPVHNADGHQGVGNNGFGAAAVGGNNGGLTPDYQATVLVAGSSLGGLDDDAAALASVFPQQDPTTSTSSGGGGGDDASSADVALFEQSSYDPCFCPDGGLSCLCVVYYQCINGSISTSGYNLLDDRLSKPKVETCPGVQKCCREPLDNEIEGTPSPEPPPFTPEVTPPTPGPNPVKSGCGVRRNPSPNYDNTTNFSEFPWMLIVMQAEYLGDGSPPVDIFKCGGSLIHPQVALTAAHCVHQILPSDLTVRAGEWDAQSSSEPLEAQDRKVSRVIKHPGFEKETLFNDIALLVLDSPMKEAPNVDVTCLPQPTDDYNGARCIATGWGTPRPDLEVFQTTLKKVEVPIVDRASCQKRLRTTRLGRFFQLHKSFICAGGEPGVDTCKETYSPPPHGLDHSVPNSGNSQFIIGFGRQKPQHVLPEGHSVHWNRNTNQNTNVPNVNFRPPQNPYYYNYFYKYAWGNNGNVGNFGYRNVPHVRTKRSDGRSYNNPPSGPSRSFQISIGAPPGQQGFNSQFRPFVQNQGSAPYVPVDHQGSQNVPFGQGGNSFVQNQGSPYVPFGQGGNSQYVPFNHNHGSQNVPFSQGGHAEYVPFNHNHGSQNVPFGHGVGDSQYVPFNHNHGSQNVPFGQGGNSQYVPFGQNPGSQNVPFGNGGNSQYVPFGQNPGSQNVPFGNGGNSPYVPPNQGPHGVGQGDGSFSVGGSFPDVQVVEVDGPHTVDVVQDGEGFQVVIPSEQGNAGHTVQIDGRPSYNDKRRNPDQQSVAGESGQDSTLEVSGDGGGPLFCPWKEDPSRYIQVGVVSWGIGCGGTDIPAVYSSLAFFRDWVDDTLLVNAFENIAVPPPNLENEERIKG